MITDLPGSARPVTTAHAGGASGSWQSGAGEIAFAGLMVLPGLVALGVMLWVIVAVVLH